MNTQTETEAPRAETAYEQPPRTRRWLAPVLIVSLLGALAALLALGIAPRLSRVKQLEQAAALNTTKYTVAIAAPAAAGVELALPSSVEAVQETPIYPRVNGYIKALHVDIGSRVQAGDALAEIEAPELDEQVNQARAALTQAEANLVLAEKSFGRWNELQKSRVVADQEVDERKATLDARQADRVAAQATLQRLQRMQDFQKITAPFSGTVTKRLVEVGQLVTGDLNDTTRILFQVARTDELRAFINVPQSYFRSVGVGQKVELTFREMPGRTYAGKVARTSGALESTTRTLRTEVRIPNVAGELMPGLFADVKFLVQREHPPIAVPARALILQSSGPQIATLDQENRVALRTVTLGRDLGAVLEVLSGLEPGARFISNPSDTIREGAVVEIAPAPRLAAK